MKLNSLVSLILTLGTTSAFASGSPALYCKDLTTGSRLQIYASGAEQDAPQNAPANWEATAFVFSGPITFQETLDNSGNTRDSKVLNAKDDKTWGTYEFSGLTSPTKVMEEQVAYYDYHSSIEANFVSQNGSTVTVDVKYSWHCKAGDDGLPNKTCKPNDQKLSGTLRVALQPADQFTVKQVAYAEATKEKPEQYACEDDTIANIVPEAYKYQGKIEYQDNVECSSSWE